MASLTHVAIVSRKSIRYGIYLLVFLLIARFLVGAGITLYKTIFPEPPPEPEVEFSILPNLPFPDKTVPENITYKLETAEGGLPTFVEQLPVYFMPPIASNIRALEFARQKATALDFEPDGKIIVENVPSVYTFNKRNSPATLTMNIVTGVFSINYDLNADPSAIENLPPDPEKATKDMQQLLKNAGLFREDLISGPTSHEFLKIEGGDIVKAPSQSEADFIKVNLFRKNFAFRDIELPSMTPEYPEANVWFMIAGGSGVQNPIIAAEYHYFPVDEQQSSTYPIKTSQQAWEDLQAGKGFIANLGNNEDGGEVTIRKVYLGYYDAGQYTQYLQPIAVFEGDNSFIAYVPIVSGDLYGKEAPTETPSE
jgi:hypothetical protein